jgi:opine dehydrogenase
MDSIMSVTTVAVLGAGHGGCAAAADLGRRGFSVRLHARNPERLHALRAASGISARGIHQGLVPVDRITADLAEAVHGADLIMLVVPSIAHAFYAAALAPRIADGQAIFLNPGHTGGGLHFLHALRGAGFGGRVRLCETVTLTYITRLEAPALVNIYSYTTRLRFAALPGRDTAALFALIAPLYPNIVAATSVLETGLGNINAVFHPPGMIMNAGWIERRAGDFLFYREGITAAVGRVIAAVDGERLAVAKALAVPAMPFLDLFHEAGLTTQAAREAGDIARACEASEPNRTIKAPAALDHRYLHEDVGYGLVPMAEFGHLAGVATPAMDALIHLAGLAVGIDYARDGLTLRRLGLAGLSPADLVRCVGAQEG